MFPLFPSLFCRVWVVKTEEEILPFCVSYQKQWEIPCAALKQTCPRRLKMKATQKNR